MKASDIRKALLEAQIEVPMEEVPIPEAWRSHLNGARLFMRAFSAKEWAGYISSLTQGEDGENILRTIIGLLVDENGDRVFSQEDVEDIASHPGSVLKELQDIAFRISGLSQGEEQAVVRDLDAGGSSTTSIG